MIEGGPCSNCGVTQASIWYGKRTGHRYCKKAECMRAGGYLGPKKMKAKRVRAALAAALEDEDGEAEVINEDTSIIELIDIYGQRCAQPTPQTPCNCLAQPNVTVPHCFSPCCCTGIVSPL